MRHVERSDEELIALAQGGSSPAFAVLFHRYADTVRGAVGDADGGRAEVTATFVAAVRSLDGRDPADPVAPWLLGIAGAETSEPVVDPGDGFATDDLDAIWCEIDRRWPDGRRPVSPPRWLAWVALSIALAALAVLVPYAILELAGTDDDLTALPELVARPFDEELPDSDDAAEPSVDDTELEPPPFEFPDVDLGEDDPPAQAPTVPPTPREEQAPVETDPPIVQPPPGQAPAPQPQPEPEPQPDPEPAPEPDPAPDPPVEPPDDGPGTGESAAVPTETTQPLGGDA